MELADWVMLLALLLITLAGVVLLNMCGFVIQITVEDLPYQFVKFSLHSSFP